MCITTRCKIKKIKVGTERRKQGETSGEKSKEEKMGKASFGRRSDDTAHPSQWQVPAVAPLQRTQANVERQSSASALHFDNTTMNKAAGTKIVKIVLSKNITAIKKSLSNQ